MPEPMQLTLQIGPVLLIRFRLLPEMVAVQSVNLIMGINAPPEVINLRPLLQGSRQGASFCNLRDKFIFMTGGRDCDNQYHCSAWRYSI